MLLLIIAASILASCVKPGESDVTTNDPAASTAPTEETTPIANDLKIIVNGESNSSVIRSDTAVPSSMQVTCATDIRTAILEATGTAPSITTDWSRDGVYDEDAIEILVGHTNYKASTDTLSNLTYGEYSVKVVGNKLVVAAYTDGALRVATNKLISLIKSIAVEGSLTIPADTEFYDVADKSLASLPSYDGGTFSATYESGNNATQIIIKNTTAEEYEKYLDKLAANGFTEYTSTAITDNLFATYTNSDYTINAGYYDYESSARIIIEDLAPPVGLEADNVYTEVTTSQITMFGLQYTDSAGSVKGNGLSVLMRLVDGRFVIIDGGFNTTACMTNLLNAMKEQSKDYIKAGQKIKVAAWIITHPHGDHSGAIGGKYSTIPQAAFEVERFLVNFLSETERYKAMNTYTSNYSSGEGGGWVNVINAAKYLNAVVHYARVGQIFYFADLKVEVLYTIDSFAPQVCNALNTSSFVTKMTFGDGTVYMNTGDTTGNGLQICARMFGDYLKSDIVQVAHHGYSTWGNDSGVAMAYRLMLPTTVLWPQGSSAYPNYKTKGYNVVLFSPEEAPGGANPNFKEIYVAGLQGEKIIVPIPYSVGNAIVTRLG